jgi:long-chain fatty acid transport protein
MGMNWDSSADSFVMPAVGWAKRDGDLTYGAGAFAQGGMGTDYDTVLGGMVAMGAAAGASAMGGTPDMATAGTVMGWDEFSEVGVMRILFPLSKRINDKLNVGGSVDYVRAGMDLKMVMTGSMMMDMMTTQNIGTMSGSMVTAMQGMMGPGGIQDIYGGYFDFADSNDYTGQAEGDGFAGKIGFTYQATPQLTVGGTYHTETSMSDLTGGATVSMAINMGGTDMVMPINGQIAVKDFQWPATMALGVAFQANDKTMIVADVKKINWSDVMKDFKVSFTAADTAFAGTTMDAVMFQNWDDQTVIQLGVAHELNEQVTLRAGANVSDNPIPNSTAHYLFPAIVEKHYTIGAGFKTGVAGAVNMSVSMAPDVKQTNDMGMELKHDQLSYQIMYSMKF